MISDLFLVFVYYYCLRREICFNYCSITTNIKTSLYLKIN